MHNGKRIELTIMDQVNRLVYAGKNSFFLNAACENIAILGNINPLYIDRLQYNHVTVINPLKSVIDTATNLGFTVIPQAAKFNLDEVVEKFPIVLVSVTRNRMETTSNLGIALSLLKPFGKLILEGSKKNGIEPALKTLSDIIQAETILSKSHGKVGLFIAPNIIPSIVTNWLDKASELQITKDYISAPGFFSAKQIDPASKELAITFQGKLYGKIADLGAGWGYLSAEAIKSCPKITSISLFENHYGALSVAEKNIESPKAQFLWTDVTKELFERRLYDFVILNPPFHSSRRPEPNLGITFIKKAVEILLPKGKLWLVANRNLPYEDVLKKSFSTVEQIKVSNYFKIICASHPIKFSQKKFNRQS